MTTTYKPSLNELCIDPDICPKHNTEVKKVYSFGRFKDVEISVFEGCDCATLWVYEGFNDPGRYYTNYNDASGAARLALAQLSS